MLGQPVNPKTHVQNLFRSDDAYGSALLVATAQIIPLDELSQMAVDTVVLELRRLLGLDITGSTALFRLQAAMGVMFTPELFYEDLVGFIDICNALSGEDIDPDVFDPADPYEMSWAIAEARFLDPPDPGEDRWSREIKDYMGMTLVQFGFGKPPANMSMARMPEGANPAMLLADQPDLVTASVLAQDGLSEKVNSAVREQIRELHEQLKPFRQPDGPSESPARPRGSVFG